MSESLKIIALCVVSAVGAAHGMSYAVAGLGGALRIWQVWRSRRTGT